MIVEFLKFSINSMMGAGFVKRYINAGNREQISILPMCFDDMISQDSIVRAIDAIVDNMNIISMGFTHSETKETGRMPWSLWKYIKSDNEWQSIL